MTKWTDEQKEAIYKEGSNIIVSAGAGSGKTAVLTERVLEKVKKGISLSNLLILTFTKMAAKEMKERIGEKLKKEGLVSELNILDAADITTFDAYALSLVKKYHYLLNLPKDISIIESSSLEIYKRNTLREIFDTLYEKEDKDFLNLIDTYCIKDDNEIFNFILNTNSKLDLKTNKKEYLDNYISEKYNEEYIDYSIKEYEKTLFNYIDNINNYLEYIDDNTYLEKLHEVLEPLLNSSSYNDIIANINITLPRALKVSEISKEYKTKISDALNKIKKIVVYNDTNEIKESIISTKEYVKEIIKIINLLDEKISNYKNSYGYYEYHDIANFAIKLVKENTEIREEIKNNLNEILIDEYQDTNDIQEEFISYISNNNVYMVGDIKQSIYRFRNANPYIFKNKYDKYSNNINGIKIDLNKNFRSREEVLDNINLLFDRIMDDDLGGASYKKSHRLVYGNPMYQGDGNNHQNNNFEVYSYLNDTIYNKNEIEAFIIANDIKNKIENNYLAYDKDDNTNRKIKYSDFVILMDNSKNFELYKKILEYNKIPTTIMKSSNLLEGNLILVIRNIINLIIKIKNNIFDDEFKKIFLSLGRSFLFNIDDDTLFSYFLNNNFKENIIYTKTKEISDIVDNTSLEDLLDIIINKYNFNENLILVGDYEANTIRISKLKEIINNLVNLNYDIYKLNDYLNDITKDNIKIEYNVNESNTNTVKIMTIHASKGLEFNVCYYSNLYSKFNIREIVNKYTYDSNYGIIIPYKKDFLYNTIYHELSYINYVKENIGERIRLFYVALTRAKEKMIFALPQNTKDIISYEDLIDIDIRNKYNSFASIMYSLESVTKKYYKNIDLNKINLTKNYNLIKNNNYKDYIATSNIKLDVKELDIKIEEKEDKSFSKDSIHLITEEESSRLDYGTKIHELFELTDFKNINYSNLTNKEKNIIDNFINNIDLNYKNIYKEYEFIYEKENTEYHGIIDLMLEYDDKINIIDYKLKNIDDDAYLKQLMGYKNYIKELFKKEVTIFLYSIYDNNLKEIKND